MQTRKVISVYFNGSNQAIADKTTLGNALHHHTNTSEDQVKKGVDGCFITHGVLGILFGHGIDGQCQKIADEIAQEIKQGHAITLNCYGHSRGGIAALMLAKKLKDHNEKNLEINLALHDPLPGNYLLTTALDVANITLTRQTLDVSEGKHIKRVLALYPNEPYAFYAHAPLFPTYPSTCVVEQDIIPGCHSGAQRLVRFESKSNEATIRFDNVESFISFARIKQFLATCGTIFNFNNIKTSVITKDSKHLEFMANDDLTVHLPGIYESTRVFYNESIEKINSRDCHSKQNIEIQTNKKSADFLNLHHKALSLKSSSAIMSSRNCVLQIKTKSAESEKQPSFLEEKPSLTLNTLIESFVNDTNKYMTKKSQKSTKGQCVKTIRDVLKKAEDTRIAFAYLISFMKVILQRDRNVFSLFSTTTSGDGMLKLLNSPEYAILKKRLLPEKQKEKLSYNDLVTIAYGIDDMTYCSVWNKEKTYSLYKEAAGLLLGNKRV